MAILYNFGKGVPQNYELAFKYYNLAISQGYSGSNALNNLGVLYLDGKGTPQDLAKAEELFTQAIKQGNIQAQENLDTLRKTKAQAKTPQIVQAQPVTQSKSATIEVQDSNSQSKGLGIVIAALIVFVLLIIAISSGDDSGKRTCPWCNGTGYSGNGAQSAVEYVYKKTPCSHCNGTGSY